jgi:hypothetical protein
MVGAGPGWGVDDQPVNSGALVGGTFDDAGFCDRIPAAVKSGLWVGATRGPGTFRRSSFRAARWWRAIWSYPQLKRVQLDNGPGTAA